MSNWTIFVNSSNLQIGLFTVSGITALAATLLSCYLVFRHLKHWNDPIAQRCIVRILFMVVVYSLVSWFAVVIGEYSLYFTLVRDCYEAYVLYQFFCLLLHYLYKEGPAFLGTDELDDPTKLVAQLGERACLFPFCCTTYQASNRVFVWLKRSILQYVFIKPLLSAIAILLQMADLYRVGSFNVKYGYFWISLIAGVSATVALYAILVFYELIKRVIFIHRPFAKLVSIKLLIFVVFWQTLVIASLYYFDAVPRFFGWSRQRSAETVQNVLICVEMLFLALFNLYAFPYLAHPLGNGGDTLDVALENIQSVVSQKDVVDDLVESLKPDIRRHND